MIQHYVDQTDFNAHDILLCINTGEKHGNSGITMNFQMMIS